MWHKMAGLDEVLHEGEGTGTGSEPEQSAMELTYGACVASSPALRLSVVQLQLCYLYTVHMLCATMWRRLHLAS